MSLKLEAPDARWQRPGVLLLRVLILVSPLLAIGCIRLAGSPILAIELAIVGLALVCLAYPDNHVGVVMVVLIGIHWLTAVDHTTTPWAIAVAVSVAILHTSMAAVSVGPIVARWTGAMRRRWTRRFMVVAAMSVPTWAVVAVVDRADLDSSAALLTAALLILAIAGIWARHGHMSVDSPNRAAGSC